MKWEINCPEIEAFGGVGGMALTSNQSGVFYLIRV
jgi:hypothetical protein